jgi:hypothetical protein
MSSRDGVPVVARARCGGRLGDVVVTTVAALVVAAAGGAAPAGARPDEPGSDLFTFDAGDIVETFDTARFRVHFTRAGPHRVPVADVDASGIPDHVERLGAVYETALDRYLELGFRAPISDERLPSNGGDDRFDVYLVDFARAADGAWRAESCVDDRCTGYMVQENDFAGYGYPSADVGNRTVGSHELFHAVQAAYDSGQGAVFAEGTAVWASERFDASLFDLEGFAGGYLDDAATPLDAGATGPVDPFGYGAGIFFQFLDETLGPDVIRTLWESVENGAGGITNPDWFATIDGVLRGAGSVGFADAFAEFTTWTLFTARRHDATRGFAHGDDLPARGAEPATLPAALERFVVFTASSRLVGVEPGDRARVALRLVGDGDDVAGVRAFLLPVAADGRPGTLVAVDDVVAGGAVDLVDADADAVTVLALIVNTRQAGQGARPRLCLGSDDEVASCADAADADAADDDAGNDDAGGCAAGPSTTPLLGALLALRRRRRHL